MKKICSLCCVVFIVLLFAVVSNAFTNDDYRTLKSLSEQGNANTQWILGSMYYNGDGIIQDYREAAKWFKKAAVQGHTLAQHSMGILYLQGHGVARDYVQSHMFLNIASAKGDKKARELRDQIAKEMTPAQVAEAQRLAREWMAKYQQ